MEERRPYWKVIVSLTFSLIGTVLFIGIGAKLIFFFMPFVIGWFIAFIANPLVRWLEKRLKIVRKLGSVIIIMAVLGLIVVGAYFGISKILSELLTFLNTFPDYYTSLSNEFKEAGERLQGIMNLLPSGIQNGLNTVFANLNDSMGQLISKFSEPTVVAAGNFAKALPSFLIATIVTVISAYFFVAQREEVIKWANHITPKSIQKRMGLVIHNMKYAVGGYFKAQLKIMVVIFAILLVGFSILHIKYAVLVAVLIAVLDFFPFFGTGTAMIPWALFKVLTGDYKLAIWLVAIYIITQVVRQVIQPKLVADSVGMNPLVTLFLLYLGYKVGSVLGMIFAVPIGMIVINMFQAGAFDYILDDAKILIDGVLSLRE
ncbi:sporulation integral membrane protein YtvI [Lachnospiraceae bacterium LCP25S3_G4]